MYWFNHDIARLIPQKYRSSSNAVKYCALTCSNSVVELSKLCKFIRIVNNILCPLVSVYFFTLIWCKYICIFDIYLLINNSNQYRYIVYIFNENLIFILSFFWWVTIKIFLKMLLYYYYVLTFLYILGKGKRIKNEINSFQWTCWNMTKAS